MYKLVSVNRNWENVENFNFSLNSTKVTRLSERVTKLSLQSKQNYTKQKLSSFKRRYRVSHSETSYSKWLRGRRINNFLQSWCLVASGGLGIWVSSTSFQKSDIGWPQQPLTKMVVNFNMIFQNLSNQYFFKTSK